MPKMTVTKDQGIKILKAAGFIVADKWDTDKLQEKLRQLHEVEGASDKFDALEDEGFRKLCKKATVAAKQGFPIFVTEPAAAEDGTDSEEDAMEEAPKPKKPAKPAGKPQKPVKPEAKKAEKPTKPKAEKKSVEKDEWGTRKGTRTARINAALLTGKALTTKEIEAKANARGIHSHLVKLKNAKLIFRTDDGKYQMTAAKSGGGKPAKKK